MAVSLIVVVTGVCDNVIGFVDELLTGIVFTHFADVIGGGGAGDFLKDCDTTEWMGGFGLDKN